MIFLKLAHAFFISLIFLVTANPAVAGGPTASASNITGGIWKPLPGVGSPGSRRDSMGFMVNGRFIVFGGLLNSTTFYNDTYEYNPATDTWDNLFVGPPLSPRANSSAVQVGSKVVVWGGRTSTTIVANDGSIYNGTNWVATSGTGALSARSRHTAVTDGFSRIYYWGGTDAGGTNIIGGGAIFDVNLNNWTAMNTTGTPTVGKYHSAVWTGTEMIIYGGCRQNLNACGAQANGAKLSAANVWTGMSTVFNDPARAGHSAVWTGSEMIVWGGGNSMGNTASALYQTGGRYNPISNTWTDMVSTGDLPDARAFHNAIWTGTEMIVWGGYAGAGIQINPAVVWAYNPNVSLPGGRWRRLTSVDQINTPSERSFFALAWNGLEMFVFGGSGVTSHISQFTNVGGGYRLRYLYP